MKTSSDISYHTDFFCSTKRSIKISSVYKTIHTYIFVVVLSSFFKKRIVRIKLYSYYLVLDYSPCGTETRDNHFLALSVVLHKIQIISRYFLLQIQQMRGERATTQSEMY